MVKILIAEDDASLNRLVCGHLNAHGYEATGVPDGRAALEKMETAHFDMLISDIMMPVMDGFSLAETVRAADKAAPGRIRRNAADKAEDGAPLLHAPSARPAPRKPFPRGGLTKRSFGAIIGKNKKSALRAPREKCGSIRFGKG